MTPFTALMAASLCIDLSLPMRTSPALIVALVAAQALASGAVALGWARWRRGA